MAGFKDAGQFTPTTLSLSPELVSSGGIDFDNLVAVKHPNFRLRRPDQMHTRESVSQHDLTPIKAYPKGLSSVTVPEPHSVLMGIEFEFTAIDLTGNPVSLYGRDCARQSPEGITLDLQENLWPIDEIPGLSPEGLKFQAEIAAPPGTTFTEMRTNLQRILGPVATAFQNRNWLMLPTGLSGLSLDQDFANISPHLYIGDIMTHGLDGSAKRFDSGATQGHVDHGPFGSSLEFLIHCGNAYNGVLATMLNALFLSAPFYQGKADHHLSHREQARRSISTHGGVQDNIPVSGWDFLARGHRQVASGKKPVPERAGGGLSNGSHNDFRPKLSTGTGEHGSTDSHPNIDLWIAQCLILRRFTEKLAEIVTSDSDSLPSFLTNDSFPTRAANRDAVARWGPDAALRTTAGKLTVRKAWNHFFTWASPPDSHPDWDHTQDIVQRTLAPSAPDVESYFDPASPHYLHGIIANTMLEEFSKRNGPEEESIKQVNVAVAQGFMGLVQRSLW